MTSSGRSIARLAGLLRAGVARGETAAAAAASRAAHRAIVGSDRQRHHDLGRSFSSSSSSSSSSSEPSSTSKSGGENRHAEASSDRVGAGLRGDGTAPRFYKSVSVVPQKDAPGLWGIALDGKTLKTPSKAPLAVPSKALALAVAAEWEWQSGKSIRPFTMPLMALVATAMDQMSKPAIRAQHIHTLLEFFPTDVVLCRHEPSPLADYQAIAHEPVLRWARKELGDVTPTESIFGAEDIPEEVTRAASKRLDAMDAFELTATFNACASAKSLLIGLALVRGAITVEEATRAARAEEDFQTEEWGLVEGGHDVDAADVSVRLRAPRAMMSLLRVVG